MRFLQAMALLSVGAVAGFGAGVATNSLQADEAPPEMWGSLGLFAEVYTQIQSHYVEPVEDAVLVEAAIRGMVGTLDQHSRFLSVDELLQMQNDTRGEYVGIGIELTPREDGVYVGRVFEGGPAADAGVQADDRVLTVDGEDVSAMTVDEISSRLRGERGQALVLGVQRVGDDGAAALVSIPLVRDVVHLRAVTETMPVPGYGVVSIASFQSSVGEDVRAAIDRLQAQHGRELDGLVLDLRNNPGGLLNQAISVADAFMSEGVIVSTAGRDPDERNVSSASRSSTRYRGPLIVLVNGGSASASEVVAGALQDSGRAQVVGTQSYGKGSVQSIIELPGGAGLKLTVSLYYTPDGRSIHGEGITPDVVVELSNDALASEGSGVATAEDTANSLFGQVEDVQVRAAIELLHQDATTP
jgi:carboxyl-terminal processing protease